MIKGGLKPYKTDHRDYDALKSFGAGYSSLKFTTNPFVKPVFHSMVPVLLISNPFQVFNPIVNLYAVLVVYLRQVLGIGNISLCNKPVYKKMFSFFPASLFFIQKYYSKIPSFERIKMEKFSVMFTNPSRTRNPFFRIAPQLSVSGNSVQTFKLSDVLHKGTIHQNA